jgi:hypothetical protein
MSGLPGGTPRGIARLHQEPTLDNSYLLAPQVAPRDHDESVHHDYGSLPASQQMMMQQMQRDQLKARLHQEQTLGNSYIPVPQAFSRDHDESIHRDYGSLRAAQQQMRQKQRNRFEAQLHQEPTLGKSYSPIQQMAARDHDESIHREYGVHHGSQQKQMNHFARPSNQLTQTVTPIASSQQTISSTQGLSSIQVRPLEYTPLTEEKNEIRLLTFLIGDTDDGVLHCKLETVSLNSVKREDHGTESAPYKTSVTRQMTRYSGKDWVNPYMTGSDVEIKELSILSHYVPTESDYRYTWGDFAALSYVWGSLDSKRNLIINGQATVVGANLEAALRSISVEHQFNRDFKLWVDALCINQNDIEERSKQVCKMHAIYSEAWIVISWIGDASYNSKDALNLVTALSAASLSDKGTEVEQHLDEDPGYLGTGSWLALHDLMQRDYWSRVWIIQELVLGSSSVVLRCGDQCLDWPSFCIGLTFLSEYLWEVKDLLLRRDLNLTPQARLNNPVWLTTSLHLIIKDLWPLSKKQGEKPRTSWLDFNRLLVLANSANCGDVRDKVYGLVGMMDPAISQHLVPDYRSSPGRVFERVARVYIETYNNLEPVLEGNPWGTWFSPTWAATWDWNGRLRYNRSETKFWGHFWEKTNSSPQSPAEPYGASAYSKAQYAFSADGQLLQCGGFILDKISGLGAREAGYFGWPKHSIVLAEHRTSAYGDEAGIRKALYTALVADRVDKGRKAEDRHAAIFNLPSSFSKAKPQFDELGWKWLGDQQGYYFRWEGWLQANRDFTLWGHKLGDFFDDTISSDASEYDFTEVYCGVDRTAKGRRFMTTENGYLGWCPSNMYGQDSDQTLKGDLIVILFGCSMPVVIRPCGEYFKVVGGAYVQGFMDGEAMRIEHWNSGRFQQQLFTFC